MLRLSVHSTGLIVFLAAASLHSVASTPVFSGRELGCLSGYGEANCSRLPNNDLHCSVDRNGTRCDVGPNEYGLTYCTIRWRVYLTEDGGVSSVSFSAYRESLSVQAVVFGEVHYHCDDSAPTQSVVTTRCNTASCCKSAEFTIPSICLYRRPPRPRPTSCYSCAGPLQCNPGEASCNLSADEVATCIKQPNLFYSSGCSFTVLLFSNITFYYASNDAPLKEDDRELCVASNYSAEGSFMTITCNCRGDECNSGINFSVTDHTKFGQFSTVSPSDQRYVPS